ncbi:MAG: DHH family phosphoesterase [Pygmaiobacter massiliensis]|nr:DHH family phosphoesterase [Pygmaiobacter massiliensis]
MRRTIITIDIALALLAVACVALAVLLALVSPTLLLIAAAILVVAAVVLVLNVRRLRRAIARLLNGVSHSESATQASLANLSMPVLILSGKSIVWYNDAFLNEVMDGQETCLQSIYRVMPGFDPDKAAALGGARLEFRNRSFQVNGSGAQSSGGLYLACFQDLTDLRHKADRYDASRPVVMRIVVDTYDEVLKELKESEKARITSEIDAVFERFIEKTGGFLQRVSAYRYIAVMEDCQYEKIVAGRFEILEKMRAIGTETGIVTLSIGVGRGGGDFAACLEMADAALDMALGRGGDQAAVRSPEGFEFYGGVTRSVERHTKVKSRIVAAALRDIIEQSDSVLIMGHKLSDLDAIGSAIGMLRICKIYDRPAAIVVDKNRTMASSLIDRMCQNGYEDDFVTAAEALPAITPDTLLVVVDTHVPTMVESREIYDKVSKVVVVDHHRKMVGHIEGAVIFYHEPYASSASELVAELLQYTGGREDRPNQLESEALLAGMMLDTRDFVVNAGVRTFEAAAYLRRMGALTQNVKLLFAGSLENYTAKAKLVESAIIYKGCAIVVADHVEADSSVVIPQAANDLLSIEGVQASFVAVQMPDKVMISARSMGEVNVQVIMEKLGGGGHLMMAGAQLTGVTMEKTKTYLMAAVDEYRKNQSAQKA